ncbi:MAG: NAD(P)-dependent oxidoreductase [Lachnospiraceae bacterium]|nr:NAD(P)-dependent oxidoreductase [Lachnospiraceae bacterium]
MIESIGIDNHIKKVVITGATGMIGCSLIEELLKYNIEVLAIVNPNSPRISRIPKHNKVQVLACRLEDLEQLFMNEKNMDHIYDAFFHLAWSGTIGDGRNDMLLQNRNIKYTLDAVALAKRLSCKVFLGAGSQAEYGRVEEKINSNTPTNPENGYGIAKLCAGQMSRIECEKLGIKHIWVRILSVYGPCDGEATMIISGIRKMLRGEQPEFSKGEQQWDYLYCADAGRALYLAAEKGKDKSIYPIGSGKVRPLSEYIELMENAVKETKPDARALIGALPYRDKQVMYLCADIEELTKDTGFIPEVSFEEGIKKTVEWCKQVI